MAYNSKFTGAQIDALLDSAGTMQTSKEDVANKVTSINADADDAHYPSAKAVLTAINNVAKNATFAGIATPATNPGTPDGPVFYIATQAGTYSNFGGIEVANKEAVILWWRNGSWVKVRGLASTASVEDIFSDMNASVLIAGSMPNFNTTNKTFDIGDDSFIISNNRYYEIKSLVADGSYRNLNYCVAGETSSLQKFVYNTISKTLRFENAIRPAVAGDIVLGCIKRVLSTGVIYYVGFTFKYAIDGVNDVDNLKADLLEIKPKIEILESHDGRITKLEEAVYYTKVEELYQNAWVRYSNGEVVKSGGGAKLYIIKKEYIKDATKIKAFVTTESTTFAAIAFYNGEPGASTYMQGASIQGKNNRSGAWYEASLPTEDWYCALVLDMSQYGNRKSILIDEPYEKVIRDCVTSDYVKSYVDNKCGSVLNVVAYYPFYHHFSQEQSKSVIPAQSLFDIHYAKSLGFRMIEVNVHKCSDGVYVCKHGINGTLGQGLIAKDGQDYSSTKFADVTSEWLRENISYNVYLDKYKGFIPTLDEFCRECKKLSMIVKISTADRDVLNIARKYLPDDMLWTLFNERGDYRGTIEYVYSKSNNTVDAAIAKCKIIGAPLNIVIAAGTFTEYTDEELTELCEKAHINGFTVSMVYPRTNDAIRALSFGVDAICATNTNANLMSIGNAKNISSLDDSDLVISEGSQYVSENDVITLVDAGTIKVNADKVLTYKQYGMCSVRVRYKGVLTIIIGKNSGATNLAEWENDGNKEIAFCNAIQPLTDVESFSEWITIQSKGATEIYSLDIKCSYL